MTSSELLSAVRTIIDETEAGGTVSDNEIYQALTQAQDYIANLIAQAFPTLTPEYIIQLRSSSNITGFSIEEFVSYSGKVVYFYPIALPTDMLKLYNISIDILDNQAQEEYRVTRGVYVLPEALKTNWSWRGRLFGRQDEFYYTFRAGGVVVAIATNNNSFSIARLWVDYLQKPTNISSTIQPKIIGCDSELIAYASYLIFHKLRLSNAQLQFEVFANLISGKIGRRPEQ